MIIDKSEGFAKVLAAIAKANAVTEHATKNKKNSHFKNEYADLSEVIDCIKSAYSEQGLAVIQTPTYEGGQVKVYCTVVSQEGDFVTFAPSEAPASKLDSQGVGSAITYLRRYSASAMAFITQDDDDGKDASVQQGKAPKINVGQEKEAFNEITDTDTLGQAWKACVARIQAANQPEVFEELKAHVAQLGAKLGGK